MKQAPGGGRDLYASPDGNVYQRRNDGWYRREAGGGWRFYGPVQGSMERNRAAVATGAQRTGGSDVHRPMPTRAAAGSFRVPDAGDRVRAQEIANLERAYYARSLGQMRAQNSRAVRPVRGGRRR
jgi:hypothetical protein